MALKKVVIVTDKLDSLSRSYTKKGFTVTPGPRDALGHFEDSIKIRNGSLILLQMPFLDKDSVVSEFGACVRELHFVTSSIQEVSLAYAGDSTAEEITFDTKPARIIIMQDSLLEDTAIHHPNRVHRIDWVLLSASYDVQATVMKIFSNVNSMKMHDGCCDFWRIGTMYDPTFFRFEPSKKIKAKDSYFFAVESDNIYFAY